MKKIEERILEIERQIKESQNGKSPIKENKSFSCSKDDTEFYRVLFNVNPEIKRQYMFGINNIMKEVFSEKWRDNKYIDELPGVYDLEKPGRSVINKLNTNYSCFCILVSDLNNVISKETDRAIIDFTDKTPSQQLKEVRRFVNALSHYKERIFNSSSNTFSKIMGMLGERDEQGSKREEITKAILKRFFGKNDEVNIVGRLGGTEDALKGIDLEVILNNVKHTAQVKPFANYETTENGIVVKGTGNVKLYNTDWMVFQKGKNVLVFNRKPTIIDGNFVFPTDSLKYDIN